MSSGRNQSLLDSLPSISKEKAVRLVVYGLIIAMVAGVIGQVSTSIDANATAWRNMEDQVNLDAYYRGDYGYHDYLKRGREIEITQRWMQFQDVIFGNVARVGAAIGMLLLVFGFLGLGLNPNIDPKMRLACLILGGAILFVMIFTVFFNGVAITIG